MTDENYNPYPKDDKIIPYSPRKQFGFTSPIYENISDKIIDLESMKNMSIDQIIELYKDGYTIEGSVEGQQTPMRERERRYGFANQIPVPTPTGSRESWERQTRYGFTSHPFEHEPPGIFERDRRYGFAGPQIENTSPTIKTAQGGISVSTGALLLIAGGIALFYYMKSKGNI